MNPSPQCPGSGMLLDAPEGTERLVCPNCGRSVKTLMDMGPARPGGSTLYRLRGHRPEEPKHQRRPKAWYHHRTARDAPLGRPDKGELDYLGIPWDLAQGIWILTQEAWAQGYNAAVQAYIDTLNEHSKREQGIRE